MSRRLSPSLAVMLGLGITVLAMIWFWHTSRRFTDVVFIVCPGIAFTAMLALGSDAIVERLRSWIGDSPLRVAVAPAAMWALYAIYAVGMKIAVGRAMAVMAIYLAAPFLILSNRANKRMRHWLVPVAILWIWLPLEFGLIRRLLITTGRADLHYAFAQMLAIDAGIISIAVWAAFPDIGYRFEYSARIVRNAVSNFLMFAAIAIPLGILIGFIRFDFNVSKLALAPAWFAGIFLFTGFPEEFLFRGLIQNWIEKVTSNRTASLIIAATIFGASHLNNGVPIPNYRYFLMAGIAGIFYGRAWRNTGTLMSSSLTHALVDTCWSVFFR